MSPRHRSALVYLVGIGVLIATVLGVVGLGSHRRSQAREDAACWRLAAEFQLPAETACKKSPR